MKQDVQNVTHKILFIISSLSGGGAQHVTRTIVNHLDRNRFEPIVVVFQHSKNSIIELRSDVSTINLSSKHARYTLFKIIKIIRRLKPDIVFSVLGYINLLIMLIRPWFYCHPRMIARETNLPAKLYARSKFRWLYKILYRRLYHKFDLIICQSNDMKTYLRQYNPALPDAKLRVIHNPVDFDSIARKTAGSKKCLPQDKFNLLTVGKLTYQKGFDLLIKAMAKINNRSFFLTILGKGPEEKSLRMLIDKLNLNDCIQLAGYKNNPYKYMKQADLFVLSSRFEGFPNVLLEANACGSPIVAFSCPGGIKEIIDDGVNGWTVPPGNIQLLAEKIKYANNRPLDRNAISQYIQKKFDHRKIISRYEEEFCSLLTN